jgi:hypothetical protein
MAGLLKDIKDEQKLREAHRKIQATVQCMCEEEATRRASYLAALAALNAPRP